MEPAKRNRNVIKTWKKYQPAIGSDDLEGIKDSTTIRARDEYKTSRVRDKIAFILIYVTLFVLVLAGVYGTLKGDIAGPVVAVWAVVGPLLGAVVGYYFRSRRNQDD